MSTKVHQLCDGQGRPIAVLLGPGQGSDSRMFTNLLDAVRVPRPGPGRPRTTPDAVMADKACSSRAHRALLRRRGITTAIAEPRDQRANRKRRGSAGGRPRRPTLACTPNATSSRTVSNASSNGAPSRPATTSSPSPTAPASSYTPSPSGYQH
nr:transposase [Arsenicicoccus dermatophilus]